MTARAQEITVSVEMRNGDEHRIATIRMDDMCTIELYC